jgi:hypothetical protein
LNGTPKCTQQSKNCNVWLGIYCCVEQTVDLHTYFQYLGVPIYDFGDNKTVMDRCSIPLAKLHKRHNALSFHHVDEAVASRMLLMYYVPGEINPADILSKDWGLRPSADTTTTTVLSR